MIRARVALPAFSLPLCLFLCLFGGLWAAPARALSMEDGDGEATKTINDYIKDYVDVPEGAVNWKTFGETGEKEAHSKTEDGYDNYYSQPVFTPAVKALDGQTIRIKGYMFPLDEDDDQKLFLFGPFPMTCPFQYHVGPPLVLEVHADKHPVTFTYDAITVTGTLELVPDDPDYSVFYRLNDAKILK
jgi:hypothetical protein